MSSEGDCYFHLLLQARKNEKTSGVGPGECGYGGVGALRLLKKLLVS